MSDSEIHDVCSKFDITILEEASLALWNVWKAIHPKYPTLQACISALTNDSSLYQALKSAHTQKKYGAFRQRVHVSTSSPPPGENAPSPDTRVQADAEQFLEELRPSIKRLILGELELPSWSPDDAVVSDSEIKNHICSLRIPLLNGKPSVLLHDLGRFAPDPELAARLENIFMPNHHTFLVNTSGSGKTRLLLEGLCKNWGFYFTSLVDSSQLGSSDIQNSIHTYLPDSPGFKSTLPPVDSPSFEQSLQNNRHLAERMFNRALLARLLVFNLFLECLPQVGYPTLSEHEHKHGQDLKHRWLLLQLQPKMLRVHAWDIFDHLLNMLFLASDGYINGTTKSLLSTIRKRCFALPLSRSSTTAAGATSCDVEQMDPTNPIESPFFLVLDEAQYSASQHLASFRSSSSNFPRPVLREMVRAWELQGAGHGLSIVVAGTGISKDVVDQAMASAVMKEAKYRWCSDTGAFESERGMREYVGRYLPSGLLEGREGRRLVGRMWYWLRGRHRFTAGYIAELLSNGFQRPHSLLDSYIHHFTHFRPTDARECVEAEGPGRLSIVSRYKLDFHKLKKHSDAMIATIYQMTNQYMLRSFLPITLGSDEAMFVEYGFARFIDASTQSVAADEPLVLLAAANWCNLHYRTTYDFLAKQISNHEPHMNGFENYLAYCLAMAFSQGRHRVDEVFSFCGKAPAWAHLKATLVSLYHSGDDVVEVGEVDHMKGTGPSVTLGVNAKSTGSCRRWLEHRLEAPVCFPHASMGPDLLFVLELGKDGGLIWVAVQAKYSTGKNGTLSREYLRRAIRSVTPAKFFIDKDGNAYSPSADPTLVGDTLSHLEALPRRRPEVGTYGVLRVVASFPADTALKRCSEEDLDKDHHPLASLNMQFLKNLTKTIPPENFLHNLENKSRPTLGKRMKKSMCKSSRKRLKI